MNTYGAFYKGKEIEVQANTQFEAQKAAAKEFKVKDAWKVAIMLKAKDGVAVIHDGAELD